MLNFNNVSLFVIFVSIFSSQESNVLAQTEIERFYSTGEIQLIEQKYLGSDEKIGGQANYLHGIGNLRKLVPGTQLQGEGVVVAVWDGGLIHADHQDLKPRVMLKDPAKKQLFLNNHATHVGGTIGGSGAGRESAKGVAPLVTMWSYDFGDDISEMNDLEMSNAGVSVSNHSYGFPTGWSDAFLEKATAGGKDRIVWVWSGFELDKEDRHFGQYGSKAKYFDEIAKKVPTWSIVVAAGNTRAPLLDPHNAAKTLDFMEKFVKDAGKYNLSFSNEEHRLLRSSGKISRKPHLSNRRESNGFDSISFGPAVAKNVITVGAMSDPPFDEIWDSEYETFKPLKKKHVVTTDFSSWGPADDGRIKPDIIANGHSVLAPAIPEKCLKVPCKQEDLVASDNSSYVQMSGTSMAAPVVSGTVAILNELSVKKRSRRLRSDEAKAILIHTALSPADTNGPTYRVGWGALQAELAGRLLIGDSKGDSLRMVSVSSSKPNTIKLKRGGSRSPRVTLVWLDREGVVQKGSESRSPLLNNDIDITLTTPTGKKLEPWTLDPDAPANPAKRGKNTIDNVERIDVPGDLQDVDGEWTLQIHGSWKSTDKVEAALAIWGFEVVEKKDN